MIEASPLSIPQSYVAVGNVRLHKEGGDLMRFYTNQHQFYC